MPKVFNIVLSTFFKDIYEDTETKPRTRIAMGLLATMLAVGVPTSIFFACRAAYYHNKYVSSNAALETKDKSITYAINNSVAGRSAIALNVPEKAQPKRATVVVKNEPLQQPTKAATPIPAPRPSVAVSEQPETDIEAKDAARIRQRHIGSEQLDSVFAVIKDREKEVIVFSASADAESIRFQHEIVDSLVGRGFTNIVKGHDKVEGEYMYGRVSISKTDGVYKVIVYPQNKKVQR